MDVQDLLPCVACIMRTMVYSHHTSSPCTLCDHYFVGVLASHLKGLASILEVVGVGGVELEEGSKVAEGLSEAPLAHAREQLHVDREDPLHIREDSVGGITGQ